MICKIKIDGWQLKDLPEQAWVECSEVLPGWPENREHYWNMQEFSLVDLELIGPVLLKHGVKFEILSFGPHNMLVTMSDRLKELEKKYDQDLRLIQNAGGIVHVHIPNLGLMLIDEVSHLDDACTDELQGYLNDGWRILAVCPPNAQRRPDYILGRTKHQ